MRCSSVKICDPRSDIPVPRLSKRIRRENDARRRKSERYFSALESIAASVDGRSVSEIAESCDLPIATAHRLLQNLQHAGLVVSGGSKRRDYRLGKRLLRLLHAGSDTAWLTISAQPILDRLANEIADTCYLARLVGHEVVAVA
jgi:DNA-binding IclR family transcriptional regulator